MKKRYFILTFVLILILPLLFACGNGSVGDTTQNTNAETTLSPDTTSPSNVNTEPRWPELIKDNKPLWTYMQHWIRQYGDNHPERMQMLLNIGFTATKNKKK